MICHHHDNLGNRRDGGSEKLIFFIGNVSSVKHLFKFLCDFLGGSPSCQVNTLQNYGSYLHFCRRDTTFF